MKKLFAAVLVSISALAGAQGVPEAPHHVSDWTDVAANDRGDRYQVDSKYIKYSDRDRKEIVFVQRILLAKPEKISAASSETYTSFIIFSKIYCNDGKAQMLSSLMMSGDRILAVDNKHETPKAPQRGSVLQTIMHEICTEGS